MDINSTISRNLQNKLSERDITVTELSRLSKVSQPTIWRYVHGVGNPQVDRLKKIADSLGMEISELLK